MDALEEGVTVTYYAVLHEDDEDTQLSEANDKERMSELDETKPSGALFHADACVHTPLNVMPWEDPKRHRIKAPPICVEIGGVKNHLNLIDKRLKKRYTIMLDDGNLLPKNS